MHDTNDSTKYTTLIYIFAFSKLLTYYLSLNILFNYNTNLFATEICRNSPKAALCRNAEYMQFLVPCWVMQ